MKVLAERFRKLRAEYDGGRGISLERIAQKLEVSTKSVTTWERGTGDPNLENLLALADFFGVAPDYLLGRRDDPKP